jgi:hypothetical protein
MNKLKLFAIVLFASLLAGCAGVRTVLRPAQTNAVPVVTFVKTPQVQTDAVVSTVLNPVPGMPPLVTTNFVFRTNYVTTTVTNIVNVVTPEVTYQRLEVPAGIAGTVSLAAGAAPVPWAGTAASVGLALAGAVFGFINQRRAKQALGEKLTLEDVAVTLVENVETLRTAALKIPEYKAQDLAVIRQIESEQRSAGPEVHGIIRDMVEDRTADTYKA